MDFISVAHQMVVLFLAITLGFIARKLNITNEESDKLLSRLVLAITLPCTILSSVVMRDNLPDPVTIGIILGFSCLAFALLLLFAYLLPLAFRLDAPRRGAYNFMLAFGNTGFLGYPVLASVFGNEAILYGVIFNIPFNILVFTVGVLMLSQKEGTLKDQLKDSAKNMINPSLIACVLALFLALGNISHLEFLGEAMDTIGAMTTPAALLIIGSSLATVPVRTMITHRRTYVMAAFRLLIIPAVIWLVLKPFIADPLLLGSIVILSGMPVATNATMLCLRYGGDLNTILRGTFVTTVLSLATIPILALMLGF